MKAEDGREKQGGKPRGISKDYDPFFLPAEVMT